jgi:predicted secreted Zn-dependent protease
MVAASVLQMRREGNAKYYSINGKTLAQLADALRTFV